MIDTLEPLLSPPLIRTILEQAPGVSIRSASSATDDINAFVAPSGS